MLLITLAMATFQPIGLEPALALSIAAGSLPFGVFFGFLFARHISSKADAAGVYRRQAHFALVVLAACVAAAIPVGVLLALSLSLSQSVAPLWGWAVGVWGLLAGYPPGILLFEHRSRSRLWILWIPSPWLPKWVEYHLEYYPGKSGVRPSES
jgi:hypothetical protein